LCTSNPDNEHSLIYLPTGDGLAIAFIDSAARNRRIFSLLKRLMDWTIEQNVSLRIGVHNGMIGIIRDINHNLNICGSTINMCQRIMDAANPNQVLFSDIAYKRCVGNNKNEYTGKPFSQEAPAIFEGTFEIIDKHGNSINTYVMHLGNKNVNWNREIPYFTEELYGKVYRTQYIVNQFKDLNNICRADSETIEIFEQSAFTTFGVPANQNYLYNNPTYSKEYFDLLVKQRNYLYEISKLENVKVKLIIWPLRDYDKQKKSQRLQSLLEWMKDPSVLKNNNIDWVLNKYSGPNKLIIGGKFCLEGLKFEGTSGYERSKVIKNTNKIKEAINEFENCFKEGKGVHPLKQEVIDELEKQL